MSSVGKNLHDNDHAFLWLYPLLPCYVSNPETIEKCRKIVEEDPDVRYADRVDHHVPIFKENVQIIKGTPGIRDNSEDSAAARSSEYRNAMQYNSVHHNAAQPSSARNFSGTADGRRRASNTDALQSDVAPVSNADAVQNQSVLHSGAPAGSPYNAVKENPNNAVEDDVCHGLPGESQNSAAEGNAVIDNAALDDESAEWVEFLSPDHFFTHLPKSSKCDICVKGKHANAPHRRIENQSVQRQIIAKELLPKEHLDLVVVDRFIFGESNQSARGDRCCLRITDLYTGMSASYPSRTKDQHAVERSCRHFAGRRAANYMTRMSCDRAPELSAGCDRLGWIHEPSAPRQRLHNPVAERGIRTIKEMSGTLLEQSGFNNNEWHLSVEYGDFATAITKISKCDEGKTQYHAAVGHPFAGKMFSFGQLIWYKPPAGTEPAAPQTLPGLFIGWDVQPGVRFKGLYRVCDYQQYQKDREIKIILTKEVLAHTTAPNAYPVFPVRNAKLKALKVLGTETNLDDIAVPAAAEVDAPVSVPFAPPVEVAEEGESEDARHTRITINRIMTYGRSPGCEACAKAGSSWHHNRHTVECKRRFDRLCKRLAAESPASVQRSGAPEQAMPSSSSSSSSANGLNANLLTVKSNEASVQHSGAPDQERSNSEQKVQHVVSMSAASAQSN